MTTTRFFTYAWHQDEKEHDITSLRIYGLSDTNKNVCVRVSNFTPYVYLELPETVSWTESQAQQLGNKIDDLMGGAKPIMKSLMWKKRLYYASFENGKCKTFPYLFCSFSCTGDINLLQGKIRKPIYITGMGAIKLKMHEQTAWPAMQFASLREIPTAGWSEFTGKLVTGAKKVTYCDEEYIVKWKNIKPYNKNEVASPLIMGMDIEVNSSNPKAFPNAQKPEDVIFQIACVFERHSSSEPKKKIILSLFDPDQKKTGDDVEIRTFETECDLLLGYTALIQEKQPNIIVGYNILGFDIPYMVERAKLNCCIYEFDQQGFDIGGHAKEETIKWSSSAYKDQEFEFLDAEGRLFVDLLPLVKRDFKLKNFKLTTISQHLLGSSKDPLNVQGIFKCYRLGKRGHSSAMAGSEKGVKIGRNAMGVVAKYCVQDTDLCLRLMEKLQTWVGLCEMSRVCNVPPFYLYTQGQQIKVYAQVYKYCTHNNYVVEKDGYITGPNEHYVGAVVFDPIPGVYGDVAPFDFASLYPTIMIAYNIDYSTLALDDSIPDRMCTVMDWYDHVGCEHDPNIIEKMRLTEIINSARNDITKIRAKRNATNDKFLKMDYMKQINTMMTDLKPHTEARSVCNKKKNKHNMCAHRHYRFVKPKYGKGVLPTILQDLLDARKNTRSQIKVLKKLLKGESLKEVDIDTVGSIVSVETMKKSKNTEALSVSEKLGLKLLIDVLNKRQLSYKVSANSMYGAMGVSKSRFLPFMPGAMCTTAMGRVNNKLVSTIIPEKYEGELIYGDTDSCYIKHRNSDNMTSQEIWDWAVYVATEVTKLFPYPMVLEFEQVIYKRLMLLSKKRYMYWSCVADGILDKVLDKNGNPTDEILLGTKGVLLSRRDNSPFVRDVYAESVMKIFEKVDRDQIIKYIIDQINDLCSGKYNSSSFVITKAVGGSGNLEAIPFVNDKGVKKAKVGSYTVPILHDDENKRAHQFKLKNATSVDEYYLRCLPAVVQLAEKIKRRGTQVDVGTRLEYIITMNGGLNGKQWEKIEDIDYYNAHSRSIEIDFMYYLKALANPLDQMLNIMYDRDTGHDIKFDRNMVLTQHKLRRGPRRKLIDSMIEIFTPTITLEE
jgi:DNA polymerase elongation subunit (family B)